MGGLLGAGLSKLPSLELLELRELVRDMGYAPPSGTVEVRLFFELRGGVTCPGEVDPL